MTLFRVNIKATDPGLDAGLPVLFPTAGEILRDAWWEVVTAWNASPALADVGQFVNGYPHGIYGAAAAGPVDVTLADSQPGGDGDMLIGATENDLQVRAALGAATPTDALRAAPARFTSDAPLLVVVSKDGTPSSAPGVQAVVDAAAPPTFAGGDAAAVTADTPPTIPAATPASVTADAAPTIPAPVPAYVVASAPARVGEVGEGNETFQFGPAGSEVLYTVAAGTYATLADLEAAMLAATGGSGTFGDFVTLADDGATITATAKAGSGADNGWDFQSGTGGDFLHHFFNVAYAYPGFAAGDTLAGGSAGGLVVTTGANDTFKFGAPGGEVVYTVAAGTYTTLADVANAMLGAENPGHTGTLFDIVAVDVSGTKLEAVTVLGGVTWNGWDFLTGATDFLAASGFANAQSLEGGTPGGTPTGATEGELNLYLEIEAPYPPAPWYAPTKPNVPAFPWAGQV